MIIFDSETNTVSFLAYFTEFDASTVTLSVSTKIIVSDSTVSEDSSSEVSWIYDSSTWVIAAICGNFWEESSINSGIYESLNKLSSSELVDDDVYGGYGLGQWTNDPDKDLTRRTELIKWLKKNNYAITSYIGQMKYLFYENIWYTNGYGAYFSSLKDFMTSDSTDLELLTYAWMNGWEGLYTEEQYAKRYNAAQDCYDYIIEHWDDESITEFYYGNYYLSEAERYNNAVMLWRLLTSGEEPDGTIVESNKLPVWYLVKPYYKIRPPWYYGYGRLNNYGRRKIR